MNKKIALKTTFIGILSMALLGCGGENLADHPDLLSSSAHCITATDFGGCLLARFVNHPASLSYPEKLEFSPYYDQIAKVGYDRELRRKKANKFTNNLYQKDKNDRAFLYSDMYLNARSKTPEGTRKAISTLTDSLGLTIRNLDPIMEQWLENSGIFDDVFAQALLMKYSDKWMIDSSVWAERPGMESGKSSFEVLSRAFKKIGDQASADRMIAEMKQQRFYPLRKMLQPVYAGRKSLLNMNGNTLKEAGFFVTAIKPLTEKQIAENKSPKTILSNLVFATRYGQGDNKGDQLVEMALNYAYEKNDTRSIIRFADQMMQVPINFSNSLLTTLTRSNRLAQDLILIQYLDAIGDEARIAKITKMWDPLSQPLPSGKYPAWAGGSVTDYINVLHHARRTGDIEPYLLQTYGEPLTPQQISRFKKSPASLAGTLANLKKIESKASGKSKNNLQNFYTRCANEGGISKHKFDVQIYCANKIQSQNRRILAKLNMAENLYRERNYKSGRELTKEVLSEAAACACIKESTFSRQSSLLSNIIIAELGQ